MGATLQAARDHRLSDAVSVNARINTTIERKYRKLQTQPVAAEDIGVRASILVKGADDAEELHELMLR